MIGVIDGIIKPHKQRNYRVCACTEKVKGSKSRVATGLVLALGSYVQVVTKNSLVTMNIK